MPLLACRPASLLRINKKPKAFTLIKQQVREALRKGLIPQRAAVTEAGPRTWAEKETAPSRKQSAMSNTNCGRLSGSGPRLCNEASNRVPGHCESCPKHLTWIRLKFDSSEMSPGLSGCCCSPELSWISSHEPLASSLTPIRRPESPASSPPPSLLTPLPLAAPQHWMCLLFLHSYYSVPWFLPNTCKYTHTPMCKHMHTCMCTCTNMHTFVQATILQVSACISGKQESLCDILYLSLGQISLQQSLTALCGFPLQLWPQFKLNVSLGKCLFNICLSHQARVPWGQRPSALLTKHIVQIDMVPGSHWSIQGEKEVLHPFERWRHWSQCESAVTRTQPPKPWEVTDI